MRFRLLRKKFICWIALCLLAVVLSCCSPAYIMRAAYEEAKILAKREPIEDVIADPTTSSIEKQKLRLVTQSREFGKTIGLDPKKTFTKYSRVDRDVLTWVVLASKDDSFSLHEWWFPVVGSVPYKGFFELEDAKEEGRKLERKGYEVWIRGADAFSTLGWFNDPVLSTILKNDDLRIVNTILHESVHTTVWIKDHVDFNESLANFVGAAAAIDFYKSAWAACGQEDTACRDIQSANIKKAEDAQRRELEFGDMVGALYQQLDGLYKGSASREEKLAQRKIIFEKITSEFKARYPAYQRMKEINNAEIMQLKLYLTALRDFDAAFQNVTGKWDKFLHGIMEIKSQIDKDRAQDPFRFLRDITKKDGESK